MFEHSSMYNFLNNRKKNFKRIERLQIGGVTISIVGS